MKKILLFLLILFLFVLKVNANDLNNDGIQVQLTNVNISKVDINGKLIEGAKLQIIDSFGNIISEWISDGNIYVIKLPAGRYVLREIESSEGYEISSDVEFEVNVVIDEEIIGYSIYNDHPCNHDNNHTMTYFVEINGVSYEVQSINQALATPFGIPYEGMIITPDILRNYTKQDTNIDADGFTISGNRINVNTITVTDFDVSDQTMSDQELYDKVLDIMYHRILASKEERFSGLTEVEIKFITEVALKNYLNARITTYETVRELKGKAVSHIMHNKDGEVWQEGDGDKYLKLHNKYYNREYIYDESSPTGYRISSGNGDSFGNYAKHWYTYHGKTVIPKKYAELFYYLISDDNPHPESMKLYMYSPKILNEVPYQNLFGITGYIEGVQIKEQFVEMVDEYSYDKVDVSIHKIWNDDNNDSGKRPNFVVVNLFADGELFDSIELSDQNNWSYVFKGLDLYNEGKKIVYEVFEDKIVEYDFEISGDVNSGFVITNTYNAVDEIIIPEDNSSDIDDNIVDNPNTGDSIYSILFNMIVMFSLLFGVLNYINFKYKKKVIFNNMFNNK